MIKNLSKVLIVLSLNLIVGCSTQEKNLTIDVFSSQKINFDSVESIKLTKRKKKN